MKHSVGDNKIYLCFVFFTLAVNVTSNQKNKRQIMFFFMLGRSEVQWIYYNHQYFTNLWTGIAQSVQRLATGWTVRGSNPGGVGAIFSAPVQTGPGTYSASYTKGTGSFPGVKRPGCGARHPPPSKCRGHERVWLYHFSPYGPQRSVIGTTFTFTFTLLIYYIALHCCHTPVIRRTARNNNMLLRDPQRLSLLSLNDIQRLFYLSEGQQLFQLSCITC